MARRNAGLALGQDAVLPLERWRPLLPALTREMVRIETDNRMHAWEWLGVGGGRILKADGVDHCRSHDLVGCQDAAWDLAGASIELGLELAPLVRQFHAHGGRGAAPALLAFSRVCYLAFQLGAFALAAQAARGLPEDSARLRAEMERYQALLADELNGSPQ
jgi:hypothetical protein